MKQLLFLCALLFGILLPPSVKAYSISPGGQIELKAFYTQQEALDRVKEFFEGQDVDYFLAERETEYDKWRIFVDAEPLKGWSHKCYLFTIPYYKFSTDYNPILPLNGDNSNGTEFSSSSSSDVKVSSIDTLSLAPNEHFIPLEVKNRYGANLNLKPVVKPGPALAPKATDVINRTKVVILSGGGNKTMNNERYWNDCSFIYQTLKNKYHIPRSNFNILMSDGTNPEADMRTVTGGYKSSPLDLDGDGLNDIEYEASVANLKSVLTELQSSMKRDDHLFLFVSDHGGSYKKDGSFILMWNKELLYDYYLAELLKDFTESGVTVSVLLGQCNSGGFIDDLQEVGCIVMAACKADENSYGSPVIPYDTFLYNWTSAMNGKDVKGNVIDADTDSSNTISMKEAFEYAKVRNGTKEHAQYSSMPSHIGDYQAFDDVVKTVDLFIRDTSWDSGKEPCVTDNFWNSPDIWIRNKPDGGLAHENPYYSTDHRSATLYLRVTNRGKNDYVIGQYLHTYWANASTAMKVCTWKGKDFKEYRALGGRIDGTLLRDIPAGESKIFEIDWSLHNIFNGTGYVDGERHHFCLLSQIMDSGEDPYAPESIQEEIFPVWEDRMVAQKNVSIITKADAVAGTNVYVKNLTNQYHNYTLEFVPATTTDATLFSRADIKMTMKPNVAAAWKRGGLQQEYITYSTADFSTVTFTSPQSKIKALNLAAGETEAVTFKFDFKSFTGSTSKLPANYQFDLIQRDEDGKIVGGETFIVQEPLRNSYGSIDIIPITNENTIALTPSQSELNAVVWVDSNGKTISTEESVEVRPTRDNCEYVVSAMNNNGESCIGSISLEPICGISDIVPPANGSDRLIVRLLSSTGTSDKITLTSFETGDTIYDEYPEAGSNVIEIDMSSFENGTYVLSYQVEGKIVDTRKFSK